MKNKKGITLIALIITIIVLLILAGVSISIIVGENGILNKAQESKEKTDETRIQEMKQLTASRAAMNLEGYTYTDKTGKSVYIPSSFAVSENPDEQLLEEGLVVIDKYGDEFVWVSVSLENIFERREGSSYSINSNGITNSDISGLVDKFGNNLWLKNSDENNDIEKTIVEHENGFLVSRYEIGIESFKRENKNMNYYTQWNSVRGNEESKIQLLKSILPTLSSKKGMEPVRYISQDECLELANNWKCGNDYQSGLITGRTWDTMVNFMVGYDSQDARNSSFWGNCKNTPSKNYKNIFTSKSDAKWYERFNWAKAENEEVIFPTGEFISINGRDTKMKNIYDVAGNLWEWTTEKPSNSTDNRILRGGSCYKNGTSESAVKRSGENSGLTIPHWALGFRCVVYVKQP